MAVTVMPINQVTVPARQNRQALSALMMPGPGPLRTRSGFRPGGEPVVTVTAATWSVGPFSSIVDTGQSSVTGPYLVASDATESGNMTPADETYARKDILYLLLDDGPDEDASGQRRGRVLYQAGVASANPIAPDVPARSLLVRTIDVPKAGNGNPVVTNNSPLTVASGGILPVRDAGDILAALEGRYRDRLDTNVLERDSGLAWETIADPAAFKPWPTYVPVFSGTGTAPSLGNGTISGSYIQVGKRVRARGQVIFGSSSTFGTGGFRLSVPVAASANSQDHSVGGLWILRSGFNSNAGTCYVEGSTRLQLSTASGEITPTSPHTWKAGDLIKWDIEYEAA